MNERLSRECIAAANPAVLSLLESSIESSNKFLASIAQQYTRNETISARQFDAVEVMVKKAEIDASFAKSTHIGTVGTRESFRGTVVSARYLATNDYTGAQSTWRNYRPMHTSTTYLYVINVGGNNVTAFVGKIADVGVGDEIAFTAYIKDHKTYKGAAQTLVNRIKIVSNKPA